MPYIDGFVAPAPSGGKDAYLKLAAEAAAIFRDHGATRVVESWEDDVHDGTRTDFRRAVAADKESEAVVFSWIEWPDKATRDAGWVKVMADERMKRDPGEMPFDTKRMIYGGFASILEV